MSEFSDLAGGIEAILTALAILAGAIWAYFRYVKDRVPSPKFEMLIDAGTVNTSDNESNKLLVCRVSLKNIGSGQINLIKEHSHLRLRGPPERRGPLREVRWPDKGVAYRVLREHSWVEPGETLRHDLIVELPAYPPKFLLLDFQVKTSTRRFLKVRRISVYTRKVISTDTVWDQPNDGGEAVNAT